MSPLAEILAATNRSANTGLLAAILAAATIVVLTIAAADSVSPLVV